MMQGTMYKTFQKRQKSKFLRKRLKRLLLLLMKVTANSTILTNSTKQLTYISTPNEHCREEREELPIYERNEIK